MLLFFNKRSGYYLHCTNRVCRCAVAHNRENNLLYVSFTKKIQFAFMYPKQGCSSEGTRGGGVLHQPDWKIYIFTLCVPTLVVRSHTSFFKTTSLNPVVLELGSIEHQGFDESVSRFQRRLG